MVRPAEFFYFNLTRTNEKPLVPYSNGFVVLINVVCYYHSLSSIATMDVLRKFNSALTGFSKVVLNISFNS